MGFVKSALVVGLIAVLCAPLGLIFTLSHGAGGWTRKYTSPKPFFAKDIPLLTGKVAIVTGGNSGIGLETARELARKGAHVILTARSVSKGEAAVKSIIDSVSNDLAAAEMGAPRVETMALDLSSLASVKAFAEAFRAKQLPCHVLVLNAGVMKSPGEVFVGRKMHYGYEETADGLEVHIGVNHVAHYYLTELLMDVLRASAPARVVSVSSAAQQAAYDAGIRFDLWASGKTDEYEDGAAYGQSKLANILFARELASREGAAGITAFSCHPGIIKTELGRYMAAEMAAEAKAQGAVAEALTLAVFALYNQAQFTQADGALTQLHLATSEPVDALVNGGYYVPIGTHVAPESIEHPQGKNSTLQQELWQRTAEVLRAKGF